MRSSVSILAGLAIVLLAACDTPDPEGRFADRTFAHKGKIELNVATIVVDNLYETPADGGYVEAEFPILPAKAAERWARERLKAVGSSGQLVVSILDASVRETRLEMKEGLEGIVTTDQSERYDARIVMTMEANNEAIRKSADARGEVRRSQTVPEDISLTGRRKVWYEMTEKLMEDLDAVMMKNVYTRVMDFTGRPMRSMIIVEAGGIERDDDLTRWIGRARDFVRSLPPKKAKSQT